MAWGPCGISGSTSTPTSRVLAVGRQVIRHGLARGPTRRREGCAQDAQRLQGGSSGARSAHAVLRNTEPGRLAEVQLIEQKDNKTRTDYEMCWKQDYEEGWLWPSRPVPALVRPKRSACGQPGGGQRGTPCHDEARARAAAGCPGGSDRARHHGAGAGAGAGPHVPQRFTVFATRTRCSRKWACSRTLMPIYLGGHRAAQCLAR